MPKKYSDEVKKFIAANVKGRTNVELVEMVNTKFGVGFTEAKMKAFKNNHKLQSGLPGGMGKTYYSNLFPKEIAEFIKDNHKGVGPKEMASILNERFSTAYTKTQLKSFYSNHKINSGLTGRFEKGYVPINKGKHTGGWKPTCFKTGHMPLNIKPVGSERVSVDGYVEVKTANPKTWRLKHRVVWEEANGKIPKNHCLIFLDGNKQNCDLNNLKLITRAKLFILNKNNLFYDDAELRETGLIVADLILKANERKREQRG